jgi:16S rRNA (guanine966-N2)-methyltransferase
MGMELTCLRSFNRGSFRVAQKQLFRLFVYIIAGLYRRQRLISPKGADTRPTASRLREALFNICQNAVEGVRFLDLFAGSGAMGFEALSRGAQFVTFIDAHKEAIRCIHQNAAHLQVQDQCQILQGEVFTLLTRLQNQGQIFDIIFADPPYCTPVSHSPCSSKVFYSSKIIEWVDTHSLLTKGGRLFIEEDFHHQPKLENLKILKLKDSRRIGHAGLQQYTQTI